MKGEKKHSIQSDLHLGHANIIKYCSLTDVKKNKQSLASCLAGNGKASKGPVTFFV
jgi:calcineurin-like phosphoesterase family protein